MQTRTYDIVCPNTGETVRAGLNEAELFTTTNIEVMKPETQIWWSEVLRSYATRRMEHPNADPDSVLQHVIETWPEIHRSPGT